jgi:membrane-associated phospholipid phosphatase
VLTGLLLMLAAGTAPADPSPPWTPSPAARHALGLLVDEGGLALPLTQWPLPRAAVARALDALPRELPQALGSARARVAAELADAQASQLVVTVRGNDEALSGFGDDPTPGSWMGVRTSTLAGHGLVMQLGGRLDGQTRPGRGGAQFRLDDTAIATELLGAQVQAWSHRSWWGPGWQSSLVLGSNAPPLNAIGLQRASASPSESRWLSWMGPWTYDVFAAQTDDAIHAQFIGMRLTLRPLQSLEIGLTRTAQWGGDGRPEDLKSFLRMLLNRGVNPNTAAGVAADPANEEAGFDVRWRCAGGWPCALYTQLIGEDSTRGLPGRFLGLYGAEAWSADGRHRWFAEFAETICGGAFSRHPLRPCAYRNHAYPEGYTQDGRWLGASAGPDSRVWTFGWFDAQGGTSLRLHAGTVGSRVGVFAEEADTSNAGRLVGASLRQSWPWGPFTLGAEADWLRIATPLGPRTDARAGLSVRMPLEAPWEQVSTRLGTALSVRDGDVWRPLLMGAALVGAAALLDQPLDDYARAHGTNRSARVLQDIGNAAPFVAFGLAGAQWLASRGSVEGDVASTAMLASASAFVVSEGLKVVAARARPTDELGPRSFGEKQPRVQSSFPSIHTALAWGVVTPYAQHYDMPWLYGLAALTNVARVSSREHWFSDTVAGAVLGYAIGDYLHRSRVGEDPGAMRLHVGPGSIAVSRSF